MPTDAHADELDPPGALVHTARQVARPWVGRLAARVAATLPTGAAPICNERLDAIADRLLDRLTALAATDVDEQTTNPLSLFRDATAELTADLAAAGAPPVDRDHFSLERFPDDRYGLVPSSWDDIDPALQPVGLAWGAWKALTVLRRRRDEGLR